MIQKVLIIVYKLVDGKPLFFIGKRPETGIYQPPTGHVEEGESYQDGALRELSEELGAKRFRNFIDLNESFKFTAAAGKAQEHVVAIEIGDQKIVLEKAEFNSYEFLPLGKALRIVKFENHKKFLEIAIRRIKKRKYPKIIIICGPGGGGKDTIIKKLLDDKSLDLEKLRTVTTRTKRNDQDDKECVSIAEFNRMFQDGELLEKNFFKDNWYGAPRGPVDNALKCGRNMIMEVDIHGVKSFKKHYSDVIAIFVTVDIPALRARLVKRGTESLEEISKRMKITEFEMKNIDIADYVIENKEGELDRTIEIVKEKIKGEL